MMDTLIWRSVTHRLPLFLICIAVGLVLLPILLIVFRPTYSATSHVMLVSENTARDPLAKGKDVPVLARSNIVLARAKKATGTPETISYIRAHLAVAGADFSNMLSVGYRDHDANTAIALANAVAEQMVSYYHELSAQQYDRLITYLRSQMVAQRKTIEKLDRQVQRAALADTFVSTDKAIDTITTRLDDLQGKLGDAMATLTADQAAAAAAAAQPQEVAGIMRDQQLQSDPLYQNLRNSQARNEAQLGAVKSQYTDRYPGLPSLEDQVKIEKGALDARKRSVLGQGLSSSPMYAQTVLDHRKALALVSGDQARVGQYNLQIQEQQRRLVDLSNTGVSVAVLRTERDTAMASYQALATQLSTTLANQAEASSLGALVVVDRAADASALLENLVMRIIVGILAVLALSLLTAIIVEAVDPRLRTPTDIERLYGRPVIATVGS